MRKQLVNMANRYLDDLEKSEYSEVRKWQGTY